MRYLATERALIWSPWGMVRALMLAGTCKFDVRPPLTPLVVAHVQRGKTALNKHQLYQSMKLIKRNAITIGPHDASVLTFEGRRLIWRVPRRCLEESPRQFFRA